MYKVLIVDDEIWVRKGIFQKLKTGGYDFDWIGEAQDGEEALGIIDAERPNLIITDICMSEIDGIELIRRTLDKYPGTRFIIISGYGEFEYAEQAINLGVAGYILKPIKDDQFHKAVGKILADLGQKKELTDLKTRMEALERDSEVVKIQKEAYRLLTLNEDPGEAGENLPFAGCSYFYMAILNIDSTSYNLSGFKYQDADLAKYAVKNILSELWTGKNVIFMDNPRDNNQVLALFYSVNPSALKAICDKLLIDAYSKITRLLHIDLTIALSSEGGKVCSRLYNQAWEAFGQRLVHGGNRIYRFDEIKLDTRLQISEQKLKMVYNYLEARDFKNLEVIVKDLFSPKNAEDLSGSNIRFLYAEIVNIMVKVGLKLGIDVETKLDTSVLSWDIASQFGSTAEIISFIMTTAINLLQSSASVYVNRKTLISRIDDYLEKNYSSDFSVKDLSKFFAINPDYLSALYRQETGQTLISRLTSIRIEKACGLLRDTSFSVPDVAKCAGYSDPQYFYKVFKKVTGKTPVEYKNSKENYIQPQRKLH